MNARFTWCDLSTFDLKKAIRFYGKVFGWKTMPLGGSARGDDYTLFLADSDPSAGIFTMPGFFQQIDMPSFWMSYILVEDLDETVTRAVELGGKVEVQPTPVDDKTRIALIRDPSGAGFTACEGEDWGGRDGSRRDGRMSRNELHVSDLHLVGEFYSSLFDWRILPGRGTLGHHFLTSPDERDWAAIQVLDEAVKGPKNYWAVYFSVRDVSSAMRRVKWAGGKIVSKPSHDFPRVAIAEDPQGATFWMSQRGPGL